MSDNRPTVTVVEWESPMRYGMGYPPEGGTDKGQVFLVDGEVLGCGFGNPLFTRLPVGVYELVPVAEPLGPMDLLDRHPDVRHPLKQESSGLREPLLERMAREAYGDGWYDACERADQLEMNDTMDKALAVLRERIEGLRITTLSGDLAEGFNSALDAVRRLIDGEER